MINKLLFKLGYRPVHWSDEPKQHLWDMLELAKKGRGFHVSDTYDFGGFEVCLVAREWGHPARYGLDEQIIAVIRSDKNERIKS